MDSNLNMNNIPEKDLTRISGNFFRAMTGGNYHSEDVATIFKFAEYLKDEKNTDLKKYKVAIVCVCLNEHYWQFLKNMVDGAKKFFLPGHDVDVLCWSDMPESSNYGATVFETEPVEWPLPTLMRYHLFLQQEEKLKEYDYIFYCDADMLFVNYVGDEILGNGLTAAQHPGYAVRKEYWPPYEPNEKSASYIKRPGRVINDGGKPRFMPLYFAGGFFGGRTKEFLDACRGIRDLVDKDFAMDYIPIWNDESALNKYLESHPPDVVLTPSYVYPDSLIKEYYLPLWGCDYPPKIITLTKSFSLSKEGGEFVKKILDEQK